MPKSEKQANPWLVRWAALAATLAVALALFTYWDARRRSTSVPMPRSTVERVLARGSIQASYTPYSIYSQKDPNTGKLSGIIVDAMEEIGHRLNLRVEWVEEVGFGSVFEGLKSGRYEVHGSAIWRNGTRGKAAIFTEPIFYNAVYAWVRADDNKIKSLQDIDDPVIRVAVQDGAMEDLIAQSD